MNWISVKDRFPNDGKSVLFYCSEGSKRFVFGRWLCGHGFVDDHNRTLLNVTHWLDVLKPDAI